MLSLNFDNRKIAVIGLGYVGLPLAMAFAQNRTVIGFDIDAQRIAELKSGFDRTKEFDYENLKSVANAVYTNDVADLSPASIYIVTVPTPINSAKQPNFEPLQKASKLVGECLSSGDLVIYESTVYPGATEEICVPILEQFSGLKLLKENQRDFSGRFLVGYSPERINPGDKKRKIKDIVKITSGCTPKVAEAVDELYKEIIEAGTYLAPNIKVAEAAKVIENTQRDINIAFVNELSIIFTKLGIDTNEVLNAAKTKWNFLEFTPGLVGGHCIGVDPYYLTYKSQEVGYTPEIILAGRRLNDNMGAYVASCLVKAMLEKNIEIYSSNILVMGATFKENCPDIRNSKVFDIVHELQKHQMNVDIYDPNADHEQIKKESGLSPVKYPTKQKYDGIVLAVKHTEFVNLGAREIKNFCKKNCIIYDLKSFLGKGNYDLSL